MAIVDFITELKALELNPQELSSGPGHIGFEYEIPEGIGPNGGKKVMIGAIVNDSYPVSTPSNPHYKCRDVEGWVNATIGLNDSGFGPEWKFWSRNMTLWQSTDRNAKAYLSIVHTILLRMNEI